MREAEEKNKSSCTSSFFRPSSFLIRNTCFGLLQWFGKGNDDAPPALLMMIIIINTQQHDLCDSSSIHISLIYFYLFPPLLFFFLLLLYRFSLSLFFPFYIHLSDSTGSIMGFRSRWPLARFIFIITKSISFTACRPTEKQRRRGK